MSFTTLSAGTVIELNKQPIGNIVFIYDYNTRDIINNDNDNDNNLQQDIEIQHKSHRFHIICWRGRATPVLNVSCNKIGKSYHMKLFLLFLISLFRLFDRIRIFKTSIRSIECISSKNWSEKR